MLTKKVPIHKTKGQLKKAWLESHQREQSIWMVRTIKSQAQKRNRLMGQSRRISYGSCRRMLAALSAQGRLCSRRANEL